MKKNLRHLRNLRDKKTSQEKSVYICEICGTFSDLRGYLQRPNRSPLRNSVSSDDEKNLRHLRNLRDLKNVPRKICVYL